MLRQNLSIPKSERKESKFEILELAKKIRNSLCDLAIRDFGIKDRKRCPKYDVKAFHMTAEDGQKFIELLEKYNIDKIPDKYPAWFIEKLRDKVIDSTFDLVKEIEYSNVYPTTSYECMVRREHQTNALSILQTLYQWLELAGTIGPLDLNKFDQYFDLIEHEIASIKKLRKHDNKILKKIQGNEIKTYSSYLNVIVRDPNNTLTEHQIDKVLELMVGPEKYLPYSDRQSNFDELPEYK